MHRKLGFIETYMASMHQEGWGTTQFVRTLTFKARLDLDRLITQFEYFVNTHPVLNSRIVAAEDGFWFASINEPLNFDYFGSIETQVNDDNWHSAELSEVHNILDPHQRLWRLRLLDNGLHYKIVLTFHHALFDSDSAGVVINQLLAILANDKPALPPSNPQNMSFPQAIDRFLTASQNAIKPTQTLAIAHAQNIAIAERRTHYRDIELAPQQHQALSGLCQNWNVSRNSLLSALLCQSALDAQLIEPETGFMSAVSLRSFAETQAGQKIQYGCYLAIASIAVAVTADTKRLAQDIQKATMKSIIDDCLKSPTFCCQTIQAGIKHLSQATHFTGFGISDIGDITPELKTDALPISNASIMTNRVLGNAAFVLQVSQFMAHLTCRFVAVEHLLTAEQFTRLCSRFETKVTQLIS